MKKVNYAILGLVLIGFGLSGEANAAETDTIKDNQVNVTINPGPFDISVPNAVNFNEIRLGDENKVKQLETGFNDNFNLRDFRGTQEGYVVYTKATQFVNEKGQKLPEGSLTLSPVSNVDRALESSLGENKYPVVSQTSVEAIDTKSTVSVLKADTQSGMGSFDFGFNQDSLNLTIDTSAPLIGNYQSTMTWSLVVAP